MADFDNEEITDNLFLPSTVIIPTEEVDQQFLIRQRYEAVANAVKNRDIAIQDVVEVETGKKWYSPGDPQTFQDGFRKVIPIGVPNGTPIAHEIDNLSLITRCWGTAIGAGPVFYPLPYASTVANGNISVEISFTSVTVTPGAGAPVLTDAFVVLEYLKE